MTFIDMTVSAADRQAVDDFYMSARPRQGALRQDRRVREGRRPRAGSPELFQLGGRLPEQPARDDQLLDLLGAFEDVQDFGTARTLQSSVPANVHLTCEFITHR
jgi:hypothetical protein